MAIVSAIAEAGPFHQWLTVVRPNNTARGLRVRAVSMEWLGTPVLVDEGYLTDRYGERRFIEVDERCDLEKDETRRCIPPCVSGVRSAKFAPTNASGVDPM
jgi:hypothetical protein